MMTGYYLHSYHYCCHKHILTTSHSTVVVPTVPTPMSIGGSTLRPQALQAESYGFSNIGILEKKMATTIVYWGNIGIMENKMEATIMGLYYDANDNLPLLLL